MTDIPIEKNAVKKNTAYQKIFSVDAHNEVARARCKGHPLAYVCIFASDYVSVVDLKKAKKLLDITVGGSPLCIDIDNSQTYAYVSNFYDNSLSVIDLHRNETIKTVAVGNRPAGLKVSKNGKYLYVVHYGEPNVYVLDIHTLKKVTVIPLPSIGLQIDISDDGSLAFVGMRGTREVAVIDLTVNLVVKTLETGAGPEDVKVSPNRQTVFVTNEDDSSITPINIQLAEPASPNIPTGQMPVGLAFTHEGRRLYCANRQDASVSVFNTFTRKEITEIPVGNGPYGAAATADGKLVAVTNSRDNTMSIIYTKLNKVYATVVVGDAPGFLAIL